MEYKILCKEHFDSLQVSVNEFLKDGWVPIGGAFISKRGFPSQTIIRTRKPKKVSRTKS